MSLSCVNSGISFLRYLICDAHTLFLFLEFPVSLLIFAFLFVYLYLYFFGTRDGIQGLVLAKHVCSTTKLLTPSTTVY
jgi:hypothetical protein